MSNHKKSEVENEVSDINYSLAWTAFGIIIVSIILGSLFTGWITSLYNAEIVDNNDWIGFFGAMIGGAIGGLATLIGVTYSIKGSASVLNRQMKLSIEQLNHNNDQFELSNKPYINITIPVNKPVDFKYYGLDSKNHRNEQHLPLKIQNIGKGPCLRLLIRSDIGESVIGFDKSCKSFPISLIEGESNIVELYYDSSKESSKFYFEYMDIMGNNYFTEFIVYSTTNRVLLGEQQKCSPSKEYIKAFDSVLFARDLNS